MEAAGLGLFMLAACLCTVGLESSGSVVHRAIADPLARRALMALAMGLTAVALIYSPWGKRSGAHINPAVTLAFCYLGKIGPADALAYMAAQVAGAAAGVGLAYALAGPLVAAPEVHFVATVPGPAGVGVAAAAEFGISFVMMATVLGLSNHPRLSRWTGCAAGGLLALYILVESPLSGTSMNPARTLGSALFAHDWTAWWLYLLVPPAAMLTAAHLYVALRDREAV